MYMVEANKFLLNNSINIIEHLNKQIDILNTNLAKESERNSGEVKGLKYEVKTNMDILEDKNSKFISQATDKINKMS
jgi:hypothetical protein